jgi:molybdopterin-guanine dinucleotide biosynthesis protein A
MLVGSLILAGGRSRRMGRPKESLSLCGTTMLGRTAELLLDCTWPVVVVGRGGDQELPPLPLEAAVVHDDRPGSGPLAAIATGMRHLRATRALGDRDAVFVTGCDAPYLTAAAVGWLSGRIGEHQAVVPRSSDILQPLCAVYRLDCLPTIEDLLRNGVDTPRSIAEKTKSLVLDEPALRTFDAELRFLRSINTPADWDEAQRSIRC